MSERSIDDNTDGACGILHDVEQIMVADEFLPSFLPPLGVVERCIEQGDESFDQTFIPTSMSIVS